MFLWHKEGAIVEGNFALSDRVLLREAHLAISNLNGVWLLNCGLELNLAKSGNSEQDRKRNSITRERKEKNEHSGYTDIGSKREEDGRGQRLGQS